jgi:hypothetical protein
MLSQEPVFNLLSLTAGPGPDPLRELTALPQTPELDLRGSLCNKKRRERQVAKGMEWNEKGDGREKGEGKVRTEMRQKVILPSTLDICHGDATGKTSIST